MQITSLMFHFKALVLLMLQLKRIHTNKPIINDSEIGQYTNDPFKKFGIMRVFNFLYEPFNKLTIELLLDIIWSKKHACKKGICQRKRKE